MKRILALLAFSLCLSLPSQACMWEFRDAFRARHRDSEKSFPVPHGHPIDFKDNKGDFAYQTFLSSIVEGYKLDDYEASIDYGVLHVYEGKYAEAEQIFAEIIQKWPTKYEACANYGTILEVNGKLEESLKWLKKALEISPNSHQGSEWLHLAIVEDKIAKRKSVQGSALTGQDFGNEAEPKPVVSKQATRKLQHDLFYQLNERLTFIEPKDPYIAALLFELGNVCILLDDKASALQNFEAAERYGFQSPLLAKRKAIANTKEQILPDWPATKHDTVRQAAAKTATIAVAKKAPASPTPQNSNTNRILMLGLGAVAAVVLAFWKLLHRRGNS